MKNIDSISVAGIPCDYLDEETFINLLGSWLTSTTFHHIVTLNPEMVIAAQKDKTFADAISQADLRTPDGSGLIWARWYLRSDYWGFIPSLLAFIKKPAQRITGIDTVRILARLAKKMNQSMYLLGGTPTQLQQTAAYLTHAFPGLTVHTGSSAAYDARGPKQVIEDITDTKAAILLVAYGAPRQTLWIESQRSQLPNVRVAVGVGGAFSILSEQTPRAPLFLRRHNMEWLWRLYLEPARLPRIWQAVLRFPLLVRKQRKNRH